MIIVREVCRLADQTVVTTLDIERTVKEMQSAVSIGIMAMHTFTQEVEQSVADVSNIGGQLGQIIE